MDKSHVLSKDKLLTCDAWWTDKKLVGHILENIVKAEITKRCLIFMTHYTRGIFIIIYS